MQSLKEGTLTPQPASGLTEEGTCPPVPEASESANREIHQEEMEHSQEMEEGGNGTLPGQNAGASTGANDVTCMKGEGRVYSSETAQFPSSDLTLWDIEVPAHILGHFIGKHEKHLDLFRQTSGAKICMLTPPSAREFQICRIEVGLICVAPSADGGWWRAQVVQHYKDSDHVRVRYLDYGGYVTVHRNALRQIRADFVELPFQAYEVMLASIAPLPGQEEFSLEAKEALEELTRGVPLVVKVTGSQRGVPFVHMWRQMEMLLVNALLVDYGLCSWCETDSEGHVALTSSPLHLSV